MKDFGGRRNTRIAENLISLIEKNKLGLKKRGKRFLLKCGKGKNSILGELFFWYSILGALLLIIPPFYEKWHLSEPVDNITLAGILVITGFLLLIIFIFVRSYIVFDFYSGHFYSIDKLFGISISKKRNRIPFEDIKVVGMTTILVLSYNDSKYHRSVYNCSHLSDEELIEKLNFLYPHGALEEDVAKNLDRFRKLVNYNVFIGRCLFFQRISGEVLEISDEGIYKESYEKLLDIANLLSNVLEIPFICSAINERFIVDSDSEDKELKKVPLLHPKGIIIQ